MHLKFGHLILTHTVFLGDDLKKSEVVGKLHITLAARIAWKPNPLFFGGLVELLDYAHHVRGEIVAGHRLMFHSGGDYRSCFDNQPIQLIHLILNFCDIFRVDFDIVRGIGNFFAPRLHLLEGTALISFPGLGTGHKYVPVPHKACRH